MKIYIMNNVNVKLHLYQRKLLQKMAVRERSRFNELLIEGLESEHMNYHLKQLMEVGFVVKEDIYYVMTDEGKDYSNLLDEERDIVEKQPKISVIIRGVRKNKQGEMEHLLNKRLRQPYYGKVGRLTGKVRFGETFEQAASRELYEETGLRAKTYRLQEIYRKMRHREDGVWVQDVLFAIMWVTEFSGTIIRKTEYQENFWITANELKNRDDLDAYDDLELELENEEDEYDRVRFQEVVGVAEGY